MKKAGSRPARRRGAKQEPRTLSEAFRLCPFRCPFRSFVAIGDHDLAERVQGAFAAVGGEVEPMGQAQLQELVAIVRGGGAVLVMGSTGPLRDAAKAEILSALYGAAGSA